MMLPEFIIWNGNRYTLPEVAALESWSCATVCETPDGDIVTPDHPDGWLCLLGLNESAGTECNGVPMEFSGSAVV